MTKPQKYIALPGGKECKLKNPYDEFVTRFVPNSDETYQNKNFRYTEFENNNPVLPLTEVMPEGEVFEGSEVWQYKSNSGGTWHLAQKDGLMTFEEYSNYMKPHNTRIAIKPFIAKEPVKKDAGSYLMLSNVPTKEQDGINPALLALWSNIEIWFGDIGKSESGRNFLLRMQDLYNVQLKGEDTGNLVNSFTFLKKLYPDLHLVDVVENKEERVESLYGTSLNYAANHKEPTNHVFQLAEAFRQGANWQQSQSIESKDGLSLTDAQLERVMKSYHAEKVEGIVGFVLEWVAENGSVYPEKEYPPCYYNDLEKAEILNMKSDIIKELKK